MISLSLRIWHAQRGYCMGFGWNETEFWLWPMQIGG